MNRKLKNTRFLYHSLKESAQKTCIQYLYVYNFYFYSSLLNLNPNQRFDSVIWRIIEKFEVHEHLMRIESTGRKTKISL